MIGAAFQAVFATAPAAVAAQRALADEPWPTPSPLRVRMAGHTGLAEQRGPDNGRPPLIRLATILGAGHGGRILLTMAIHAGVGATLPMGMELRDLGTRRLPDRAAVEHLWLAVDPALPARWPPLQTLDSHRGGASRVRRG